MIIKKPVKIYLFLGSPILIIAGWVLYGAINFLQSNDFSLIALTVRKDFFLTALMFIGIFHFLHYLHQLSKHYIELKDDWLTIEDGKHSVAIDILEITDIEFSSNNTLEIKTAKLKYKFYLAGYDLKQIKNFKERSLKINAADNNANHSEGQVRGV